MTGVQTCALPISRGGSSPRWSWMLHLRAGTRLSVSGWAEASRGRLRVELGQPFDGQSVLRSARGSGCDAGSPWRQNCSHSAGEVQVAIRVLRLVILI